MSELAQLVLPALRWDERHGFEHLAGDIERALTLGVGGFIVFGGEGAAVARLVASLRRASRHPLLIGADMERGAGQQFDGCSSLPPLAALGSLGDLGAITLAGRLTAREALALGVTWSYTPVCDLDAEPENPIVGTRALGSDPQWVARAAAEFVEAMQGEGMLACAKHFPGHGRTVTDSHAGLPVVRASREELEADLAPFRATIDAGVAAVMTAHVAFPALDPEGRPATSSPPILRGLLRQELGFEGLIVTDAMIMEGARGGPGGGGEGQAAVRALHAGCDLLLYPGDPQGVVRAVENAVARPLQRSDLDASLERRNRWARWSGGLGRGQPASLEQIAGARDLAARCVHLMRGIVPPLGDRVALGIVDDDLGGPYPPPSRLPLLGALGAGGFDVALHDSESVRLLASPAGHAPIAGDPNPASHHHVPLLVALYGDIRAWKGRPGYSPRALHRTEELVAYARARARDVVLVLFSHPRLVRQLPPDVPVLCAWGGEGVMQRAAAGFLAARR